MAACKTYFLLLTTLKLFKKSSKFSVTKTKLLLSFFTVLFSLMQTSKIQLFIISLFCANIHFTSSKKVVAICIITNEKKSEIWVNLSLQLFVTTVRNSCFQTSWKRNQTLIVFLLLKYKFHIVSFQKSDVLTAMSFFRFLIKSLIEYCHIFKLFTN